MNETKDDGKCPECNGTGTVNYYDNKNSYHPIFQVIGYCPVKCPECKGTGRKLLRVSISEEISRELKKIKETIDPNQRVGLTETTPFENPRSDDTGASALERAEGQARRDERGGASIDADSDGDGKSIEKRIDDVRPRGIVCLEDCDTCLRYRDKSKKTSCLHYWIRVYEKKIDFLEKKVKELQASIVLSNANSNDIYHKPTDL